MPKFTINKNPIQYFETKLRELIDRFEDEINKAKKRANNEITDAVNDVMLKELEAAERLGKQAAEEQIKSFRSETTNRLKTIYEGLEKVKQALVSNFKQEAENILLKVNNDFEEVKAIAKTLKGEKGDSPTKEELLILIRPLLPKKDIDYFDGKAGHTPKKGIDFFDGKDGTTDTPQQIADKLNSKDSLLDIKVIKGLSNLLESLRKTRGKKLGGGGGMGEPQHETFDISTNTTEITTAYPIAANGKAIFAFEYENAHLERTNHYTVGGDGRTITFSADIRGQFADSTKAAITYVRG